MVKLLLFPVAAVVAVEVTLARVLGLLPGQDWP